MATKPDKFDIRLTMTKKRKHDVGRDYETFMGHVVYMVEPEPTQWMPNDAGVRNPSLTAYENELRPLGDLGISAQRTPNGDVGNHWYGYELEYHDPFRVNLRQLEFMVKFMRRVHAKVAKLDEQWGRPEDLAAFLARTMRAIGATDSHPFGIWHDDVQISGTHYRWVDVDGLRHWLDKPAD